MPTIKRGGILEVSLSSFSSLSTNTNDGLDIFIFATRVLHYFLFQVSLVLVSTEMVVTAVMLVLVALVVL